MFFFCRHDILNNAQHGFRKGRNTQSALLDFINKLYNDLDLNKKCFGLFMDLSKAFDLVNHAFLMEKLNEYGLRGKIGNWINSYLSGRKQLVEINGVRSFELDVKIGVPQGSILGPLLFLIFINDLPEIVEDKNLIMFADDNNYLCIDSKTKDALIKLQTMINCFTSWFTSNKQHLNISKTQFINFTPRSSIISESHLIKIESKSIEQVTSTKFLGIYIDNKLTWQDHIEYLCSKLSPLCYALFRLRDITNRSVCLVFYHSHVLSRLRYGIIFWGMSGHFNRLFKLQKRIVRTIVGASRLQSCRTIFKDLSLLNLPCLFIYEILLYVKNNYQNFLSNNYFHEYDTRFNMDLTTPSHNLKLFENGPTYMGIKCFNKLPIEIKNIANIRIYKKQVFNFLLDRNFYGTEEFLN